MTARDIIATTIDAHDLGGDLTCQCGWAPPDHSCPVDPTHQCAQQDIAAWERHRADAVAEAVRWTLDQIEAMLGGPNAPLIDATEETATTRTELAEALGAQLDPWQRWVVERIYGAHGRPALRPTRRR